MTFSWESFSISNLIFWCSRVKNYTGRLKRHLHKIFNRWQTNSLWSKCYKGEFLSLVRNFHPIRNILWFYGLILYQNAYKKRGLILHPWTIASVTHHIPNNYRHNTIWQQQYKSPSLIESKNVRGVFSPPSHL